MPLLTPHLLRRFGLRVNDEDFKPQLDALNEELEGLNSQAFELQSRIAQNIALGCIGVPIHIAPCPGLLFRLRHLAVTGAFHGELLSASSPDSGHPLW